MNAGALSRGCRKGNEAMTSSAVKIDYLLQPYDLLEELKSDVRTGLTSSPKELPPKWFYDERGSGLFDEITRLPEYYLTRREREILSREASEIARLAGANTLIELGSGTADKTRVMLDAMKASGSLERYVPFDVDGDTLVETAESIASEYGIFVHAIVGDFEKHLYGLPRSGRRIVAFLGSTVGNLEPATRKSFFSDIASVLDAGDALLLGVDLVKETGRLRAAYDDARGVTAEFNRNVLEVINRRLGGDFQPAGFEHRAAFDVHNEWIEMRLRSSDEQTVWIRDLDLEVSFERGEEMRTEISAKFRRASLEAEVEAVGLRVARWWTDAAGDFALILAFAQ